jgi:hypothetical protein
LQPHGEGDAFLADGKGDRKNIDLGIDTKHFNLAMIMEGTVFHE